MKIIKLLAGIVLLFGGKVWAQNVLIKPLSCPPSTDCNPFLNGVLCGAPVVVKTSHGSPNYNIVSATNKQFKFEARIGNNGSQRTEGLVLSYFFQPNKSYTVKIIHSQPILTSQFTVTPTQPVGYLWLLSSPVSIALGSFLIHSIQIIDNSLPPPPEECINGDFDWFCDASPGGPRWQGNYTFRYTGLTYLNCNLFRDFGNTPFVRRNFVSKAIYLNPGAIVSADRGTAKLIAAADPCTAPITGRGETIPPDIIPLDRMNFSEKNITGQSFTSIKEADKKVVEIFPNPASSEINIYSKARLKEIRVIDMNGRLYAPGYKTKTDGLTSIDISNLTPGVYFAIIHTDNGLINNKFIVFK